MLFGEKLSFFFGIVSNVLWFFILIPQIYTNYKLKNSDAFSFSLVCMWIVGDIFSIMASYAKSLPNIIMYSAFYHTVLAGVFMGQILYYRRYRLISDEEQPREEQPHEDNTFIGCPVDYDNMFLLSSSEQLYIFIMGIITLTCGIGLNYLVDTDRLLLADIIGWVATLIFVSSRIPQIYLNYKRGSVEGLSLGSFIMINIANYLFIVSILVNLYDIPDNSVKYSFIISNIQWILGSFMTSFFDAIIFSQFVKYSRN
jgi:uncharacterized protein with PQ loop repeat